MDQETTRYLTLHHLDGVVRIPESEYSGIPTHGYLTHFNLEKTNVVVGKRYALPRIIKHGFVEADGREVLPELSFDNIYTGECVGVQNHLPYSTLTSVDFEHSFAHIQNADDLKRYIVERYSKSKPTLLPQDILALGVSRVLLKISKVE